MTRCERILAVLFVVCALVAFSRAQQSCANDRFCQIYSKPPAPGGMYSAGLSAGSVGYLNMFDYGNTPGAANPCATTVPAWSTPEAGALNQWTWMLSPGDPWTPVTSTCSNANTRPRDAMFVLLQSITATSTSANFAVGQTANGAISSIATVIPQQCQFQDAKGNVTTGDCYAFMHDECVRYHACNELTPTPTQNSCSNGTTTFQLTGLTRGCRLDAGFKPASSHVGCSGKNCGAGESGYGEDMELDVQNPMRNVGGSMVPISWAYADIHNSQYPTWDPYRGKVWLAWGWEERYGMYATGWLCVQAVTTATHDPNDPNARCNSADLSDGWHRAASAGIPVIPSYSEGAMQMSPTMDALISFGGLAGGHSVADMYVYCLDPNAVTYGCAKSKNPVAPLQKWTKITPHDGNPGQRDAPRMKLDPVNNKLLIAFGQVCSGVATTNTCGGGSDQLYATSLDVYDPLTGDHCPSNLDWPNGNGATVGGPAPSRAASCSKAFQSPPPSPPPTNLSMKWAGIDWDEAINQFVYYDWQMGQFWLYDDVNNLFTVNFVPGGCSFGVTCPLQNTVNNQAHSSIMRIAGKGFVLLQNGTSIGDAWQFPDKGINGPLNLTIPDSCAQAQVGFAYSCTLQAGGGVPPLTFGEIGQVPPGTGPLDPTTGILSGTPTAYGDFTVTFQVSDSQP